VSWNGDPVKTNKSRLTIASLVIIAVTVVWTVLYVAGAYRDVAIPGMYALGSYNLVIAVALAAVAVALGIMGRRPPQGREDRDTERRTAKTKRSGASIAATIPLALAIIFFFLFSNVPRSEEMAPPFFSLMVAAVLLIAAIITVALATGRSAARAVNASGEATRTNGFAIASLVLGLVGLSLLAIIFGHVSRSQMNRTGESGEGLATAGLILGYVELIATVLGLVYLFVTAGSR